MQMPIIQTQAPSVSASRYQKKSSSPTGLLWLCLIVSGISALASGYLVIRLTVFDMRMAEARQRIDASMAESQQRMVEAQQEFEAQMAETRQRLKQLNK